MFVKKILGIAIDKNFNSKIHLKNTWIWIVANENLNSPS